MPRYQADFADRPGRVTAIKGIAFQNDGQSTIGLIFIRPLEAIDRWIVGLWPKPGEPPLAIHAGIHLVIDDSHEYVVEQLVGSLYLTFRNGLNWTPYEHFKQRDRGGWHVTVPAQAFRRLDEQAVPETVANLNRIEGHPFVGEDCTAFIERAFGGRRMFADSPLLRWLGIGVRVGDPALPLLRPDAALDERTRRLLQFDRIKNLPDPLADADAPNVQMWIHRLVPVGLLAWLLGRKLADAYSSSSRRSLPVSSTARKFFK
jgi:hypothetical protein